MILQIHVTMEVLEVMEIQTTGIVDAAVVIGKGLNILHLPRQEAVGRDVPPVME
jgi:hypothetical protein